MKDKLESLRRKNNTWTLTDVLPGRKPLVIEWVYKIKRKTNGDTERFKID